jgi:16S rRNA (uracil1498-N3)-methyltransferase
MTTTLHLPSFFSSETATVEGEAHHHLFKVKRLQSGERLRIVDGAGHARWAEISGIDRRSARLALGEPAPSNEPSRRVELFVAAARPERLAWLVEKATELGVAAIRFVPTDREARSVESSHLGRLGRIAISALEQSGRSQLPALTIETGLEAAIADAKAIELCLAVLDAEGGAADPAGCAGRPCGLFVGPEGGWSPAERERFRALELRSWSLGPTVLRVETAAVVGAGIVLSRSDLAR